ncbi:MAG: hypothetical protein GY724_23835 [Actinomycetia bacterium]|nr:hypothetical protein [Actinomycetes bacterium]MCP5034323.1 hypothetical protein [Actinomycetes bacterium]
MGPVSFESLDGGSTRDAALAVAKQLGEAGIRVTSVSQDGIGDDARFRIMVRSTEAVRAKEILDLIQPPSSGGMGSNESSLGP